MPILVLYVFLATAFSALAIKMASLDTHAPISIPKAPALESLPAEVQFTIFDNVRNSSCLATRTRNQYTNPYTLELEAPFLRNHTGKHSVDITHCAQVYQWSSPLSRSNRVLRVAYQDWYLRTTEFKFTSRDLRNYSMQTRYNTEGWWGAKMLPLHTFLCDTLPATGYSATNESDDSKYMTTSSEQQKDKTGPSPLDIGSLTLGLHPSILLFLFAPPEVVEILNLPIARFPHWIAMRTHLRRLRISALNITIINHSCCPNRAYAYSTRPQFYDSADSIPCRSDETGLEPDLRWLLKSIKSTLQTHNMITTRVQVRKEVMGLCRHTTEPIWLWEPAKSRRSEEEVFSAPGYGPAMGDYAGSWARLDAESPAKRRHAVLTPIRIDYVFGITYPITDTPPITKREAKPLSQGHTSRVTKRHSLWKQEKYSNRYWWFLPVVKCFRRETKGDEWEGWDERRARYVQVEEKRFEGTETVGLEGSFLVHADDDKGSGWRDEIEWKSVGL